MRNDLTEVSGGYAKIAWSREAGYHIDIVANELNLEDQEWHQIVAYSSPSGSQWKKYNEFRSIRLWEFTKRDVPLYILSISQISPVDFAETDVKVAPSTDIFVLTKTTLDNILGKDFESFLSSIGIKTAPYPQQAVSDFHELGRDQRYHYVTLVLNTVMKFSEAWELLELIFLKTFFNHWPAQFFPFSTLCTPQDDTGKFTMVGMFSEELPRKIGLRYLRLLIGGDPANPTINIEKIEGVRSYYESLRHWLTHNADLNRLSVLLTFFIGIILGFWAGRLSR